MLQTPFRSLHEELGARFVEFAGWEMPLVYGSVVAEHQQVRRAGGLFDVSHMGRIRVAGRHARRLLERVLTRRVTDMAPGTCRYSLICNERGGVRDDVMVYRFEDHWLLVVNAVNRTKVLEHLRSQAADLTLEVEDQTEMTGMVALQGPRVMAAVGRFSREVPTLQRRAFCVKNLMVLKMVISRTGYTGEDGIEVILPASMAPMAIKLLLKNPGAAAEDKEALRPAGLAARDTLRLEAALPLYGHELDEETDPISAGLAWAVSLDKDQQEMGEKFVGQEALRQIAAQGPPRRRVGLKVAGRRTPRQGMVVRAGSTVVGAVTSGCLSPTLGYPIAMAYVQPQHAREGGALTIDLAGHETAAEVVRLPFYRSA